MIPLPAVPPLVLAALGLPSGNCGAQKLVEPALRLYWGLRKAGIVVISFSADGMEVERAAQKLMLEEANEVKTYTFAHPLPQCGAIELPVPLYDGVPLIQQQDSKHLHKTFHNNAFSGAQLLVLGDHYVAFHQVLDIALANATRKGQALPIMQRDVIKLDCQDDHAAACLFSSSVLEWLENGGDVHPALA